jgi:hypothetical protein
MKSLISAAREKTLEVGDLCVWRYDIGFDRPAIYIVTGITDKRFEVDVLVNPDELELAAPLIVQYNKEELNNFGMVLYEGKVESPLESID